MKQETEARINRLAEIAFAVSLSVFLNLAVVVIWEQSTWLV